MIDPNRKRLPKAVVEQLAALARIPPDQLQDFGELVDMPVVQAWTVDRRGTPERRPSSSLLDAAKAMRQSHAALERLTEVDKTWVRQLWRKSPASYRLQDVWSATSDLSNFLALATGRPVTSDRDRRTKASGTVHDLGFHEFVRWILLVTEECCKGRLTLNTETQSGTLMDALALLRPNLPPGLIPDPLIFATVRRIRKDHRNQLKGKPLSTAYKGYPELNFWRV